MIKLAACAILCCSVIGCAPKTPVNQCPPLPAHLLTPIEYPAPLRSPVTVEKLKLYAVELEQRVDQANDRFEIIRRDFH